MGKVKEMIMEQKAKEPSYRIMVKYKTGPWEEVDCQVAESDLEAEMNETRMAYAHMGYQIKSEKE